MITLRDFSEKPDVIFGDSPLTSLDMFVAEITSVSFEDSFDWFHYSIII